MDTVNKVIQEIVWDKAKFKFKVRKETRTFNYDSLTQHRVGRNPIAVKEEFLPLSCLGDKEPKKLVNVQIVIKKSALDPETFNQLSAYFTQNLEVSVLSDSAYVYQYVTICENRVFIHNLDSGQTCPLSLSSEQIGIKKSFLGKQKKLSNLEASELIDSGLPVYEEINGEYRILVS
jgi:hypothetical protein